MPILDVEIVSEAEGSAHGAAGADDALEPTLAQRLADGVAAAWGLGPEDVWVRLRVLPSHRYAESGGTAEGVRPVFVSVLRARVPHGERLGADVVSLARAVAKATGRGVENVHVLHEPAAAGRLAFGGRLVES